MLIWSCSLTKQDDALTWKAKSNIIRLKLETVLMISCVQLNIYTLLLLCTSTVCCCLAARICSCNVNWTSYGERKRHEKENLKMKIPSWREKSPNCVLNWKPSWKNCKTSWTRSLDLNWRSPPTENCWKEKKRGVTPWSNMWINKQKLAYLLCIYLTIWALYIILTPFKICTIGNGRSPQIYIYMDTLLFIDIHKQSFIWFSYQLCRCLPFQTDGSPISCYSTV